MIPSRPEASLRDLVLSGRVLPGRLLEAPPRADADACRSAVLRAGEGLPPFSAVREGPGGARAMPADARDLLRLADGLRATLGASYVVLESMEDLSLRVRRLP